MSPMAMVFFSKRRAAIRPNPESTVIPDDALIALFGVAGGPSGIAVEIADAQERVTLMRYLRLRLGRP